MSARSPQEIVAELSKYEAKLLFLDCEDRTYGYIGSVLDSSVSKIQRDIGNLRHDKLGLPRDLRGQEDRLAPFCQAINSFVKNLKDIDEGWPPERYIPPTPPPQEPDKPEPPPEPPSEPPRRRFDPRDTPAPWIGIGIGAVLILSCCFVWIFRGQIWRFLFPPPQPTPIQEVVVVRVSATPVPPILTDTPTITLTPTVTYTPTITPTPTITSTPSSSPTITPTPTITETPTESPIPPTQVVIDEDFSEGVPGDWNVTQGEVTVVNGELVSMQNAHVYIGNPQWQNYMIEFDIVNAPRGFSHAGLRLESVGNYVSFSYNHSQGRWYRNLDGVESEIPNARADLNLVGVRVRVKVEGNEYLAEIGSVLISSHIDDHFDRGSIIMRLFRETTIDNFKVTLLP